MTKFDRILLVGINYAGTRSELRGCINDILAIKSHFKTSLNVDESNAEFRILSEANHDPIFHPTRANILKGFAWLVAGANENTRLFFHYSGHGSYVKDLNGDEIDHRDETICPIDYDKAGMIIDDEIRALLVDKLPAGAKLWSIMDCCHSGTACDLRFNYTMNLYNDHKEYSINSLNKHAKTAASVVLLSGCRDDQTSADAYIRSEYKFMGALTFSFIDSIKDLKKAGKPVTYARLMKHLLVKMKAGGYQQIPQISSGQLLNLEDVLEIA